MRSPRVLALLAASLALPALALAEPAGAGPTPSVEAAAPYDATVRITAHGIPHITASDWGSLGYGSGYATASSSICNLADTVLTARGQRSRFLGGEGRYRDGVSLDASNLQVDAFVTDLEGVVPRLRAVG